MLKQYLLSISLLSLLTCSAIADDMSDDLSGFGDEEVLVEDDSDLAGFSDSEDELSGFSEEDISQEPLHVEEEESMFTLSGDLAFKTSAGYKSHRVKAYKTDTKGIDYSGINQAQTSLYLQLDAKLSDDWKMRISGDAYYDAIYDINSHNDYNQDTKDEYRTQLRFDDVYLQGRLNRDLDVKVGRQIVVWGKSDSIRITDVINPLDNRLPGMTDIKDLRLSTGMAKLDYYKGDWNYSFMAIAESRIMLESPARSEFFPVDNIFPVAPEPFLELKDTATSWDNMQYALAANGIFSGWDLSFYAADVLDQKWHIDRSSNPPTRRVSKVKMLGSAVNIVIGSWLIKSEVAFLNGIKYNSTDDEKNRLDALVGVDYMGITDTVLSLELANRHIFNHEDQMGEDIAMPDYVDKNEVQTALRITRSFLNDKINANALLSMFGADWQYGGFGRVWVDYELGNALNLSVGVVDYIDGDRPFMKALSNNDRVFLDITYSF